MNWFDLALVIAVVASIVAGFGRGFARTAIGFIAFLVAIICAFWFYVPLGLWLRAYIKSQPMADGAGFLLVFLGITMLGAVAECTIIKFVRGAHLTWLDRILGGAFGAVQGLLLATVGVLVFMAFAPTPLPKAVAGSRCAPYFENAAYALASAVPAQVQEGYLRARRDLERVLPDRIKRRIERLSSNPI